MAQASFSPTPRSGPHDEHPCRHRRGAVDEVRAELTADRSDLETAIAIRSYGPGRLAVGLAGPVDRAAAERLAILLRAVHVLSSRELVLIFGQLAHPHRHLARVVSRARMAHLLEGGQVELDDVPPALLVDLDLGPVDLDGATDGVVAVKARPTATPMRGKSTP